MLEVALDSNRGHGMHRADVFAGAAARAAFRIDDQPFAAVLGGHEACRLRRADARAGAALHLVRGDDAARTVDDGAADLGRAFGGRADGPDGAGGADFGTGHAVDAAKAVREGQRRLEEARAVVGAAQNLVGAGGHA